MTSGAPAMRVDTSDYASEHRMRAIERAELPPNMGHLLAERARVLGDQPAAVFFNDGDVLSYRELQRRTGRLADGLSRMGVGPGTHVGVMLDTEISYPLTWLALARLGAVTVPINPAYTARELAFVLDDAQCAHLVIDASHLAVFEAIEGRPLPRRSVIVVGGQATGYARWHEIEESGRDDFTPQHQPDGHEIANIQYTSGTTGLPKGARIPHAYWLLRGAVWNAQLLFPIRRNLVAQPFHYVDGQAMFMLALSGSGTAYIARRQSASRFLSWVRQYRVNFCSMPELVARTPESPDDSSTDLRVIYSYSHPPANYRGYERRFGCPVRQGFGMTELGSSLYVPIEADMMTGTGSVGIPSAHREVKVVDDAGHEAPRGQVGEIVVRGHAIFAGYHNRPEANDAAFLPGGWFRTGDAGRQDTDGFFYYLGRRKDMIRRSGENISAVEVEAVLRSVPGIVEAAIVAVPDPVREEEIKAYVRLDEGLTPADVTPDTVLAYCARNLARFKLPRYIAYVADFPRTTSMKIRKAELIAGNADLRLGAYDRIDRCWRTQ
jgi:crotonobetaine/carnitine-CoA ligase